MQREQTAALQIDNAQDLQRARFAKGALAAKGLMYCVDAAHMPSESGLGMRGINQVTDSSSKLAGRYLPAISLLLNADRDLY